MVLIMLKKYIMENLDGTINQKPKGNILQNVKGNEEENDHEISKLNLQKEANTQTKEGTEQHSTVSFENERKTMDAVPENNEIDSHLMQLFEAQLKDIYWAEKALVNAIPKMITQSTSILLIDALTNHLTETQNQIFRLENIFNKLNKPAQAKKCEAMAGLIKEGEEIMADCEAGAMRDAGIIAASQKVEHYEIATYGTLIQYAKTLHLNDCISYLEESLNEETAADVLLTHIAISSVNNEAAKE